MALLSCGRVDGVLRQNSVGSVGTTGSKYLKTRHIDDSVEGERVGGRPHGLYDEERRARAATRVSYLATMSETWREGNDAVVRAGEMVRTWLTSRDCRNLALTRAGSTGRSVAHETAPTA